MCLTGKGNTWLSFHFANLAGGGGGGGGEASFYVNILMTYGLPGFGLLSAMYVALHLN